MILFPQFAMTYHLESVPAVTVLSNKYTYIYIYAGQIEAFLNSIDQFVPSIIDPFILPKIDPFIPSITSDLEICN